MNEENTKELFDLCPVLFRGKDETIQTNLMPFGFECNDGWFELIKDVSLKIEALIQKELDSDVKISHVCKAFQVKEKYGGLCFYADNQTEEIAIIIDEAVTKSYEVCEYCGKKGVFRDLLPWKRTLCETHYFKEALPRIEPHLERFYKFAKVGGVMISERSSVSDFTPPNMELDEWLQKVNEEFESNLVVGNTSLTKFGMDLWHKEKRQQWKERRKKREKENESNNSGKQENT